MLTLLTTLVAIIIGASYYNLFLTYNNINTQIDHKFDFLLDSEELNHRGVFSGPANLSRLKTQLASEASKW